MKKTRVVVLVLLVLCLFATFVLTTQTGLQWAYAVAARTVPGSLEIKGLQGRLIGPLHIEQLVYRQDQFDLHIARADLDWRPLSIFRNAVVVSYCTAEGVRYVGHAPTPTSTPRAESPSVLPHIVFATGIEIESLNVTDFSYEAQQVFHLDALNLRASAYREKIHLESFSVSAGQAQAQAQGWLQTKDDYELALDAQWQWPLQAQLLKGQTSLSGDVHALLIRQTLSGALSAQARVEVQELIDAPRWDAQLQLQYIDPQQIQSDWPQAVLSGQLHSKGDLEAFSVQGDLRAMIKTLGEFSARIELASKAQSLHINKLVVNQPSANRRIDITGQVQRDTQGFDLQATWRDLAWPLQGKAAISSPQGQLSLRGDLQAYALDLAAQLRAPDAPNAELALQAQGGEQSLAVQALKVKTLQGEISAQGSVDWKPALIWDLKLQAAQINPGVYWTEWPGRLNADAHINGGVDEAGVFNVVEGAQIDGVLRDYPVQLQTSLTQRNADVLIDTLHASSAATRLSVNGSLDKRWNLQWSLQADDLRSVWPDARGRLVSKGALSGLRSTPRAVFTVEANDLQVAENKIRHLQLTTDVDFKPQGVWQLQGEFAHMLLAGQAWTRGVLQVDGRQDAHRILARLEHDSDVIDVDVRAGYARPTGWRGSVERADITLRPAGKWQLQTALPFAFAQDGAQVGEGCWVQAPAHLCLQATQTQGVWNGRVQASEVAFALIRPWLPADVQIKGEANALVSFQIAGDAQVYGQAHVTTSAGVVSFHSDGEPQQFDFDVSSLRVDLEKSGLTASWDIPLKELGGMQGQLRLAQWQLREGFKPTQLIEAQTRLHISSLAMLGLFSSEIDNPRGQLDAQVQVGGRLAKPSLSGHLELKEGRMDVPRMGLRLSDIQMDLRADGDNVLAYRASAKSGDGSLRLDGQTWLDPAQSWPTRLSIVGDAVEVINTTEALVWVSPNLQLTTQGKNLKIEGQIFVPRARLEPKELPAGTNAISSDVVIVRDGTVPVEEKAPSWAVHTQVRVILGDRVQIDGFGLRGKLAGDLLLIDEPGKLTTGRGTIRIENGVYQAYGQDLSIQRGQLIFTDSVVTDPGVDVRAIRKSGEVISGVQVSGTLKEPELSLFSEPSMAESDILAYLLLGHPMQSASSSEGSMLMAAVGGFGLAKGEGIVKEIGSVLDLEEVRIDSGSGVEQASLVIGRYLTPELYARYITGLFSVSNILQLQYQINKYLQVQTESGDRNGVDVFVTFEH